ncbi:SusC/RagA family TonB-linked outer membrane protein [Nafulsella turpanensis]|uniref:SusC/RagA family TonB-linked outer membrane protein n=1 Tax=Nafulsella turpanensis TaxID=1265690 RepID=UPI0003472576|nr:TonB-dependent receptor [Nafulsella turpanensis]
MKRILLICFVLMSALISEAWAQRTVTGTVISETSEEGLPGVAVRVKGTSTGVVTNFDGEYRIEVPAGQDVLVFSFVGFTPEEVAVGNRSVIDVVLEEDVKTLQEVVVTGYGTREKNAFTGSIGTIEGSDIEAKPVSTVEQALQGNVAGLQLSAASGTPGSTQDIRIRGVSSITAGNEPLFVIDGIPVVSGGVGAGEATGSLGILSTLSASDIESISVLKDASAAAIYGARASNGVIIITTKKGRMGKPAITFSAQSGYVSRAVDGAEMLNAEEWHELWYESLVNSEAFNFASADEVIAAGYGPEFTGWDGETNTDWQEVITNDNAMTHNYNLSARGGSERSTYYASGGYFSQDGVNIGSDFERFSGKLAFTQEITDKLTFNTSLLGSYVVQNGQLEGAAYFGNPDLMGLFGMPFDNPYNEDGTPATDIFSIAFNPLYVAQNSIARKMLSRAFNTTSIQYQILDDLKFTSELGLDYNITEQIDYDDPFYGDGFSADGDPSNDGSSYTYLVRNFNWVWRNMLDYTININSTHKVDLKAAYEAQKNQLYFMGTGGIGIGGTGLIYPSSVGTQDYAAGYTNDWAINSIVGMINYSYKGNIFLDGTIRREGNSRFSPDSRWGTFYSVGASWVLSDESFLEGASDWLNTTKIRASYGKAGNANIDLNQYQTLLSFGGAYNGGPAALPSQWGNPLLTWENSNSLDVGLDFALFNRITGSVDYFQRTTSDLLLDVPLSRTTGFIEQTLNVGEMENEGWEFTLNTNLFPEGSDFQWEIGGNLTTLENVVTLLPKDPEGNEIGITYSTRRVTEGLPVWAWYMPTWAGVDPATGAPLWYVEGKSGETTSSYRDAGESFQGSPTPTLYGGLNNRISFKGVYLSGQLYYSTGNMVYDSWASYTRSDGRSLLTANQYASQLDRWQKPGDIAENPVNVYRNTSQSNATSTRRLYDGEYLRLRDVTFGYILPESLTSPIGLGSAHIYVKGTNVWTWVKDERLEFDPEVPSDSFLDLNAPPLKTYSLGLSVTF